MQKASKPDPDFPNLPFISDAEWAAMSKEQQSERHTLEVREAARVFDALQAAGMDIFDAAEKVPTPRMNRTSMPQTQLRSLARRPLEPGEYNAARPQKR
jgi:hypothetical protein